MFSLSLGIDTIFYSKRLFHREVLIKREKGRNKLYSSACFLVEVFKIKLGETLGKQFELESDSGLSLNLIIFSDYFCSFERK